MLENLNYGARWLAAFITGRGATAIGVGGLSYLANANSLWIPAVGLTLGVPVTAMLATMSHTHTEKLVLDRYRSEIAAELKKSPHDVTMNDLRIAANGSEKDNIPGNRTLHEALLRNDRRRTIALAANILSAVLTLGLVALAPEMGFATEELRQLPAHIFSSLPVLSSFATRFGLAAVAGVASFGLDVVFKGLGNGMFGYDSPSLNLRIADIAKGQRHGITVQPEQLMGLIVDANPVISSEIQKKYGLNYYKLPPEVKRDVLKKYDAAFEISDMVEGLNLGLLPASELAFTIEGVRSGAHPPVRSLLEAYQRDREAGVITGPAPLHDHVYEHIPGYEQAKNFVVRVRLPRLTPDGQKLSFTERLSQNLHDEPSKTIH